MANIPVENPYCSCKLTRRIVAGLLEDTIFIFMTDNGSGGETPPPPPTTTAPSKPPAMPSCAGVLCRNELRVPAVCRGEL